MNVHIMIDSGYCRNFINFEKRNNITNSLYIIIYDSEIKYINNLVNNDSVIYFKIRHFSEIAFDKDKRMLLEIIKSNEDSIYIHHLTELMCKVVLFMSKTIKFHWILWGADFYDWIPIELYQPSTLDLLKENNIYFSPKMGKGYIFKYLLRKKAIKKIYAILTWNYGDYELIKSSFITNAVHQSFFYPDCLELDIIDNLDNINFPELDLKKSYSKIIMVGNSGVPTNNHIEIFKYLSSFLSEDVGILVPLSYGNEKYIKVIMDKGYELLGDSFIPLTDYYSLNQYMYILKQVDAIIMNYNRQQGVGNLITSLYLGKVIYLNSNTTTFNVFENLEIFLRDIDGLNKIDSIDDLISTTNDEVEINKRNVFLNFSNEKCLNNLVEMYRR